MSKSKYLHGYTSEEQARLEDQARLLEPYVYEGVEFKRDTSLLEVGCGIGAQSKILLKRFSSIKKLVGIDISEDQLRVARETLAQELLDNRLELHQSDARDLAILKGRTFDGAFLCWFLEHVPDPLTVLRELRKYLIPGSEVILSEVNNSSFFVDPYSPAILRYWIEFNDYQWSIKGHPYVGVQMGNLLMQAGYNNIVTEHRSLHFDARQPHDRERFFSYFRDLLLSAAPALINAGRIAPDLVEDVRKEFSAVQGEPYSVLFYSWVRGRAES